MTDLDRADMRALCDQFLQTMVQELNHQFELELSLFDPDASAT